MFPDILKIPSGDHRCTMAMLTEEICQIDVQEDLNTTASLIKTIQFHGFHLDGLLCNGLVFGCLLTSEENLSELSLVPFEEKALLARAN